MAIFADHHGDCLEIDPAPGGRDIRITITSEDDETLCVFLDSQEREGIIQALYEATGDDQPLALPRTPLPEQGAWRSGEFREISASRNGRRVRIAIGMLNSQVADLSPAGARNLAGALAQLAEQPDPVRDLIQAVRDAGCTTPLSDDLARAVLAAGYAPTAPGA